MGYISELREKVGSRPLIMVGACVLVFNEQGQLLLQKRSDSLDWGTIGGALEPGESLEEAAMRELYEEAGLQAQSLSFRALLSGSDMYYKYPHGDEVYNVMAVFEVREVTGKMRVNDNEGLDLQYFSLTEPIANLNAMTEHVLKRLGLICE
ncbi:NUDIX hydrolase [Paenibacillus sp. J5C_2022]|uniref:NUDIX hydrolase n=1 Tax=Paenibacillus sp. J5C2022 TaxID=2977129 RepID=UPI0021D2015A|nr:NUDIX hydrolase [Paenibacillus sp. J5C2022]MCU6713001.1 NUDIX hydrolase [Paenibacillus sp. J5C2022]